MILALASHSINTLSDQLIDLTQGVLDMKAGREDFVVGLTQVMALLGSGDQYLTISTPDFWRKHNVGSNGRFLSANREAVLHRGATIKRIFLVTRDEITNDKDLHNILERQIEIAAEVASRVHPTLGQFEVRYVEVTAAERDDSIRSGMNFGVLLKGTRRLLLSLDYVGPLITAVEFRENLQLAQKFQATFQKKFDAGKALTSLLTARVSRLKDTPL